MIHYRHLEPSNLDGFTRLDRSDYSSTWCRMKDGLLIQEKRVFRHPGFSQSQWDGIIKEWTDKLSRGEMLLISAFDDETPIGVAGLDINQRYGCDNLMYNFGPLWISKEYRGRGIGKRLFMMVKEEAEILDVSGLYISATPVPKTVDFYIRMGCQLLSNPDLQLFAEEPEDIHMYLNLPKSVHRSC
ncbi:MAG: GNAT family N-acetyltransferase [Candidatus Aegiribacteria sp.]|nr:GNAT family N-acetyltransferase [Candidatus Aegiribacteria sp.]